MEHLCIKQICTCTHNDTRTVSFSHLKTLHSLSEFIIAKAYIIYNKLFYFYV